jgi:hypothetical protein
MTRRLLWLIALFCSIGTVAFGETYKQVLGHETVENIVRAETQRVRVLTVQKDFITWSIATIESLRAPNRQDEARTLLTRGYHEFVLGAAAFARGRNEKALSMKIGEEFRKENVVCGPIPCDDTKCCDLCQKACK